MMRFFEEVKIKPISWIKAGVYALGITLIYYSALAYMILHDWVREDYSHCYFIPFIVLYLLWEKRSVINVIPSFPSWMGLFLLMSGLFFYWLGELGGEFFTMYISLWFVILGIVWLHVGWRKIRVMAFALFMMLTMFPFPNFINSKILLKLKLISSQLGVKMLHLYGMSAYREGNIIDLGFTQLQVVDACSGLRYLFPLLVMGILLAYFYRAAMWKRLVLVFSTIPLTILTNSLRIALTGIIYAHWGAAAAEGFFHGFSGWLIFMVSLVVLLAEIWVLRRIAPGPTESFFAKPEAKQPTREGIKARAMSKSWRDLFAPPQFVVASLLLILTLGVSMGVEFREKVPIKKSFNEFPLTIGEWTGTRQSLEQKFINSLHFSEYIMVSYRNPKGREIDFYVAYYETQRKGETTHSPETCLPGSGWSFEQAGLAGIADGDGRMIEVNRAFMEKSGSRQLIYFWFPQRGRILTSLFQVKLYSFWDALTRQRTDGALVRVITPVYESERLEDAEKRLQGFTREIAPALKEYIPE
jgi:exosortase D (VPLPA-CTERM-specific)